MSELIVRKGEVTDVDDITDLEQICFAEPWSKESVEAEFTTNKLAFYVVAELEGQVIGYAGLWNIVDEGHITNVAVSPEYRKMHIGSLLIDTLIRTTTEAGINRHTLEVRRSNDAAIGLYEKFGFINAGIRKGYYEDNGEDAIIMWRE